MPDFFPISLPGLARVVLLWLAATMGSSAGLPEAARYSQSHGEKVLLVWQRGRLVLERPSGAAESGKPDQDFNVFSISKSLAALGTLRAVGLGILSLDEPVSDTFGDWRSDPWKRRITVRDLLSQTSGLAPGYQRLYARNISDKNARALALPAWSPPGETFAYGPAPYEVLAALLEEKSRSARAWLTLPLTGVKPVHWRRDGRDQIYFSAGIHLSAGQLLNLGQLVRRRGWAWIYPLIPSRLIGEAVTGSSANPMYGLGFWLNRNAGNASVVERDVEEALGAGLKRTDWARSCLSRQAPVDLVAMVGSGGQRVYIIPSRQEIIVRLGKPSRFRDPDFLAALYP